MKKDGTEIVPNKERPTSLDIRKICAAYGCNKNCGHQGEFQLQFVLKMINMGKG